MTPAAFADHACRFGVRDAAARMCLNRESLSVAQLTMRTALRGFCIEFRPDGGLWQWLPAALMLREQEGPLGMTLLLLRALPRR